MNTPNAVIKKGEKLLKSHDKLQIATDFQKEYARASGQNIKTCFYN